jgi:chromosome segregation ATPase
MTRIMRLALGLAAAFALSACLSATASADTSQRQHSAAHAAKAPSGRVEAVESRVKALETDIFSLQVHVTTIVQEIDILQVRYAIVKLDLSALEEEIAALKAQIAATKADIHMLKMQLAMLHKEIIHLLNEIPKLQQQIAHWQALVATYMTALDNRRANNQQYVSKLEACIAQAEANENPNRAAKCAAAIVRTKTRLQHHEDVVEERIDAFNHKIGVATNELGQAQVDLADDLNAVSTKNNQLAADQAALGPLKALLKQREAQLAKLKREQTILLIEIDHFHALYISIEIRIELIVIRIITLEEELEVLIGGREPTALTTSLSSISESGESITVAEGTAVSDAATLSGPSAAAATGSVTYAVYSDSSCTKLVAASKVSVAGTAVPKSKADTLPHGSYYWQASYSGDETHQPSKSVCGSEIETVTP